MYAHFGHAKVMIGLVLPYNNASKLAAMMHAYLDSRRMV